MTTTHDEATMTQHASTSAPTTTPAEPLGRGWLTVTAIVGIMAALIALGGMILSFRSVRTEMIPAFGSRWAWLVPIVVDLTVFVFSGVDLVLARLDMAHPLARWTVYAATAGTVYLNYEAGGTVPGRVAHILMPSIWVVFIELMRHVVRRQVNLAKASHREPVPAARWVLSPWPTMKLWRRMILWKVNSYPAALAQEKRRLGAIATHRIEHGRLWRFRVSPLVRLQLTLGETDNEPDTESGHPDTDGQPTGPDGQPDTHLSDRTTTPDTRTPPPDTRTSAPRPVRPATGQTVRTSRPDTRTSDSDKLRTASLPELVVACQEYAVAIEVAPEHLTRAQIKEAVRSAGYSVSNDRVTRIAAFLDEEAAK